MTDCINNGKDTLHERLIGQHHAIVAVSKAVRRARVGITKIQIARLQVLFLPAQLVLVKPN